MVASRYTGDRGVVKPGRAGKNRAAARLRAGSGLARPKKRTRAPVHQQGATVVLRAKSEHVAARASTCFVTTDSVMSIVAK